MELLSAFLVTFASFPFPPCYRCHLFLSCSSIVIEMSGSC